MARSRIRIFLGQTCFNQLILSRSEMGDSSFPEGIVWYGRGLCCSGGLFQAVCCPEWHCSHSAMISLAHLGLGNRKRFKAAPGQTLPWKLHWISFYFFSFCTHFYADEKMKKFERVTREGKFLPSSKQVCEKSLPLCYFLSVRLQNTEIQLKIELPLLANPIQSNWSALQNYSQVQAIQNLL